jgi:uncharacterized membrane protein YjjB (DUF3815 family)
VNDLIRALACMAAACFFGMLLSKPKSTLVFTALIGLLGYAVLTLMGGSVLAFFVSGLTVGISSELAARAAKRTATLFLISALIPIVPGLGLYRSMMAISQNDVAGAMSLGVSALAGIGAIALALTITTVLFGSLRRRGGEGTTRGRRHAPAHHQ